MSSITSNSFKPARSENALVAQAWRRFHVWIASAAGMLMFANILFLIQPLPSSKTLASNGIDQTSRAPASNAASDDASGMGLTEIKVGCEPLIAIDVASSVRQIRLLLTPCAAPVRAIRNDTNGFEATLFGDASTDYLSLATGENQIVIDRTEHTQRINIVKAAAPIE